MSAAHALPTGTSPHDPMEPRFRALLSTYDKPGPRYTSYPTAVQFTDAFGPEAYDHLLRRSTSQGPTSLYLHLPFCDARCLFCACNTIISPNHDKVAWYVDALLEEVEMVVERLGGGRPASQLHLGGGTPTYFSPPQLRRILQRVLHHFPAIAGAELSIEVDPRVTTPAHLDLLAEFGFNRLSLGVQDFDVRVQEAVRRVQPLEQTASIIERGRQLGMSSINVDLIYGLPHQTAASFEDTMSQVVALRPDRLAIYGFAYLPHLKGHQKKLDGDAMPDRDGRYALVGVARRRLAEAGYVDIGMDHYALPDDALCVAQREGRLARNFMGYTVKRAEDIIAFGTSSIGFLDGAYVQNARKLVAWRDLIEAGRLPVERGLAMTWDDKLRKDVIDDIMCHFHVDKARVERQWGVCFDDYFAEALGRLAPLIDDGLVEVDDAEVRVTELGHHFVRNVAMPFDVHNRAASREGERGPRFSRTV